MMDEQKKIFFYYQPLYSYSDLFYLSGNETWKFNGNPLPYSCLENPMDGGSWQATVHGVARVKHN